MQSDVTSQPYYRCYYKTMLGLTTTDKARDLSDEEILVRSQKEPWIFTVLLERYQDAFIRKALSVLHNQLDAEEVVQDTFTKIYINAGKFKPQEDAKFSSWAYRILMNTAFTRYQKNSKHKERFQNIDPNFEQLIGGKENHIGFMEKRDAVERVLKRLPDHFVYVLRLHYIERWSQQDIAEKTGESTGTIKTRVHRAKKAFRKESGKDEIEFLLSE